MNARTIDEYNAMASKLGDFGPAFPPLTDIEDQPTVPMPPKAMDLYELAGHKFKERTPLLGNLLHSQDLAMVHAGRGIGKTHWALSVAFAVATGALFYAGRHSTPARCCIWTANCLGRSCKSALRCTFLTVNRCQAISAPSRPTFSTAKRCCPTLQPHADKKRSTA